MTEKGSDWEHAKENIQPLRQGRKMACLRAALAPTPGNQKRHHQQQAFENELRTYDGDDPMSVWHKYIQWVEQNYPKGGNSGNFQLLINQCVGAFLEDERYHNDQRYIDVWLKYACNFTNTMEIYSYMYSRNIGCKSAIFFENWAWELQQLGNTKKAYSILQEGLQRLAEPRKILFAAEKALLAKIVDKCKDNNMSEEQTLVEERSVLNPLKSIGKDNRAPIKRVGDALLGEAVQLPPVQAIPNQSRQPFQVFNDENIFPSRLPSSKETSKLVSKDQRDKENDLKPGKWSGAVLKPKSCKQSHPSENKPGFTIHQDENDSFPSQTPVKLPANSHVLSTREGHYVPPRAVFEPPNPNVVPMYSKYKVYCGAEEFQFEEIRAARWLAKRKEQERIEEEIRQRTLEEEVRVLKEELIKLKIQISTSDSGSQLSSANRSPVDEEGRATPLRNCHSASAVPVQPTEVRGTISQSSSYNHSPTRQVQALWNVSLFHNSNHKVDPADDPTGVSPPRDLPFIIHEDPKVVKEDDNENLKENMPPKEHVQNHCKRSLAGILQQSTNVPMQPIDQQDSDSSEDEEGDLGLRPLPSSQETTTAVVTPEQFNEDAARQCASTPFQKSFVPPPADHEFTSSLASVIVSAVSNWSPPPSAREIATVPKSQETCTTMPGNPRWSLGVKNLSPIMEGSREDRYKSSSSTSGSSGPYSTTTSTYYHHQTTTHTTGKSLYSLPQHAVNKNSQASNEDFIRPKSPERSVAPSNNIDPFCEQLQKRLLKNLKKPLCERCGYELMSKNMPRIARESYFVIGDKTYMVLEILWKGCNGTVFLAEENDDLQMSLLDKQNPEPNLVVLKVNKSGSEWEFYISTELQERLRTLSVPCDVTQSIMLVERAQIYNDKSICISSYAKFGTLVDLVNLMVKSNVSSMSENLVLYFTLEMLQIVSQIHRCHIIHADIKPDNFVVINFPEKQVIEENAALDKTMCLRLIDFGQSIDMQLFPSGTTFNQNVQTSGFQCTEMQEHKPWTYQTDLYGLLGSIHILLFSKYMEVQKNSNGQWEPTLKFKRYWQKDLWQDLFNTLLNVPSCESIPDLGPFIEAIKNKIRNPQRWRDLQAQGSQSLCLFSKMRK